LRDSVLIGAFDEECDGLCVFDIFLLFWLAETDMI
jgi:hypothetical protein